jgi:DNA-directed RNA polymerase specialized sigma54-like protein
VDEFNMDTPFVAGSIHSGRRGRPSFDISGEQLNYFLNHQFSVKDIACALGVSQSTIFRRMCDNGLQIRQNTNLMSDEELDEKITEVLQEFPNAGYRRVMSQLVVKGLRPSQMRVRESMQRVNPQGVALRWLRLTPRRQYRVSGPLALWHIDGNHKLIR